jgi:hypothetical protein
MPIVVYILIAVSGWYLFTDDNKKEGEYTASSKSYQYENTTANSNNYYQSERYTNQVEEPSNPYDDGSGHSAGYEWAEENDVDDCGGNSQSFIEGCEEYVSQKEDYENSEEAE